MGQLLYGEFSSWYRLLDPPADHAEEASIYRRALVEAIDGKATTLLELGSGAGHNAVHLKPHFECTLSDLSEPMLALSRALNPVCEHLLGDMRTLRLERTFDAVLVHDAICYLATESDLRAAIETAFVHTRPGGAAIFAPDHLTKGGSGSIRDLRSRGGPEGDALPRVDVGPGRYDLSG
jgi:SAM-dependent methyltransferase